MIGRRIFLALALCAAMPVLAHNDFIAEAKKKNITEFKDIIAWLKKDYELGVGHARAIAYVIRNGTEFEVRQTTGTHRDASGTLKLDGKLKKSAKIKKK